MYTGHVAIALGARAARNDVPLWVLVAAAQGCDWVEMVVRATVTRVDAGLWSHAYPFVLLAACGVALLVAFWKRSVGAGLIVMAVYLSHPLADMVTSSKPLWLGGPALGLSFTDRPVADLIVQGSACVIGWALYSRTLRTSPSRRALLIAPLVALLALQGMSDAILYTHNVRSGIGNGESGIVNPRDASLSESNIARAYDSRFPIPDSRHLYGRARRTDSPSAEGRDFTLHPRSEWDVP